MNPGASEIHDRLLRLRSKLDTEIPITQPLGIQVLEVSDDQVELGAPLDKNRNHQGTAFAGSVNALATLAGWASVWLTLEDSNLPTDLVIQDSSIRYVLPVTTDFRARCPLPHGPEVRRFVEAIERHGRGRIRVHASVHAGEEKVAMFEGRYVALGKG
jgi:thioesterase domain-containing protein